MKGPLARALTGLLLALLLGGCGYRVPARPAARPFQFQADRFAFANETVWEYGDGRLLSHGHEDNGGERRYTRRCFVLCRAALEFWKFARFDPDAPPLPPDELAERVRRVTARGAWRDPLPAAQRIVIPGFASVHQLSRAHPELLKESLGSGWASYFRPGNAVIVLPVSRAHQAGLHEALLRSLGLGHPMGLWLVNFPSLSINHAVLAYDVAREGPLFVYTVYDPNDAERPKRLEYDPDRRTFSFQRTFYFAGGEVAARAVFQTPWH